MDINISLILVGIFYTIDFCTGQIINSIAPNAHVQTLYQHHIRGGDVLGENISLEQCDTLCKITPTCVGFDWVKDPPKRRINRCFRHSWISSCNGFTVRKGVIHVDYLLCSIATCLTGGTIVAATSQDDCLFKCRQNATCASAQVPNRQAFNTTTSCIHFSVFEPCSTVPDPSNQVCRQYRRTTCDALEESIKERALLSTTTTGAPTTTIQPLLRARSVLEKLVDYHAPGGILQRKIRDVTTCLSTCSRTRDCFALDFVTMDNSCWFHTLISGCLAVRKMISSTHYKFIQCYRNMHLYGGREVAIVVPPGGSSLDACIDKCNSDIGCYGVDFNQRNLRCFHHSSTSECNSKNTKYGCDHFRLQDAKCQDSGSKDLGSFSQQQSVNSNLHTNGVSLGSYIIRGPFGAPEKWVNITHNSEGKTKVSSNSTSHANATTGSSTNQTEELSTSDTTRATFVPTESPDISKSSLTKQNDDISALHLGTTAANNDLNVQSKSVDNDLEQQNDTTNIRGSTSNVEIPSNRAIISNILLNADLEKDSDRDLESDFDLGKEDVPDVTSSLNLDVDHPDVIVRYPEIGPIRFNRDGSLKFSGAVNQDTTKEGAVSVAIIKNVIKGSEASIVANHVIQGGIKQQEVMTFPGCITACNRSRDCLATDYDFGRQECFFHSVTTVCSDLTAKDGVFHVRFAKCPMPVSAATIRVHANAPGGVLQSGIRSYRMCYTICQGDQKCEAFDFNFYARACYHHGMRTACAEPGRSLGVVHIKKKSCTSL